MTLRMALAAATLALGTSAALALPAVGPSTLTADTAPTIELVTHNGTNCHLGAAGWHYHWKGQRHACVGKPAGGYWSWVYRDNRWGWWHTREKRWH